MRGNVYTYNWWKSTDLEDFGKWRSTKEDIIGGKIAIKNTKVQKDTNPTDGSYSIDTNYGDTLIFSSHLSSCQEKEIVVTDSICDVVLRRTCNYENQFPSTYSIRFEPMHYLSIKGFVVDDNNKPIPYTIIGYETQIQWRRQYYEYETNKSGQFILSVKEGDILTFAGENYRQSLIKIQKFNKDNYKDLEQPYNITLKVDGKEEIYNLYLDEKDADKNRDLIISLSPQKKENKKKVKDKHPITVNINFEKSKF